MPKQPKRIQAWTGDRDAIHSVEDAVQWKQFAPVALNKAAALRRDPEFPQLP